MEYKKTALTFLQQVDLLASRGLVIKDKDFAVSILQRVSYYRLSAYCIPFQSAKDCFKTNCSFEDVYVLYRFDHELRMIIFDALERIEIAIRTSFTYFLAHEFGAFGYLNPKNFDKKFGHQLWLQRIEEEIKRSKETFVRHYKGKYTESQYFPIWMASEVFSFGLLSVLFSDGLKLEHQKRIARDYGLPREVFRSWLHTLVYARNLCAHHSRLWNRELAIKPTFPDKDPQWQNPFPINHRKSIAIFTIAYYLLKKFGEGRVVKEPLFALFNKNPSVNKDAMGFPANWNMHEIWQG